MFKSLFWLVYFVMNNNVYHMHNYFF